MSEPVRVVNESGGQTGVSVTGVLGLFSWFVKNKQTLWTIVTLVAGLLGGTVVSSYRQEIVDGAVAVAPESTEFRILRERVDALENNQGQSCGCADDDADVDVGVGVRVQ